MNKPSLILAALYILIVGVFFAFELYTRLFDTGNSAMAGLVTYLLTLPSSLAIEWISENVFGAKIGSSNTAFVTVLGLSAFSNAVIIYLILSFSIALARKSA